MLNRFQLRIWEWRGPKLWAALFMIGAAEEFMYIGWLALATRGEIVWVMIFLYIWQSMHDVYYTIENSVWQDPNTRRAEKIGSMLGGGLSLILFPFHV
jgi:hypothetical protein